MPQIHAVILVALAVLAAGCSSSPTHYHTLVPPQPTREEGTNVLVERVSVPPQVDRPQLVVRQGQSGLAILDTEWWGANLVDEFRSALQDQLGGPVGSSVRSVLRVDVQRFDSVPGQHALLEAVWRLKRPAQDELTCRTTVQTPAQASVSSLVSAQQSNLRQLAGAVRSAAVQGRCPAA
ncbi:MAG: PqiC family protein [Pseudomonas sp.]|uniref:PqiC family protein n=1 Tax=Pseudomonas TaxID=286 RepID=UPI0003C09DD8|nr:PqiC family protein [Pseudomonas sp. VLB120]AGZ35410.1 hypothetical protein PVLB_13120 [Pseudomonas sp. VLB120]